VKKMKEALRNFKKPAVYFDVDSTLVAHESLNELAKKKGPEIGAEIAELTRQAMEGEVPNHEVMPRKIAILKPSRAEMAELAAENVANMTPDAKEVVKALQRNGVRVGIITGNFLPAILPLAKELGIKAKDVHANPMYFDELGQYKGFDPDHPLINEPGKAEVARQVRGKHRRVLMVGDAKTDLDTKPYVDLFVGYGGVVKRPVVEENADIFVEHLAPLLLYALPRRRLKKMEQDPLVVKAREQDKATVHNLRRQVA
jgi:phosphoserine phosphatase